MNRTARVQRTTEEVTVNVQLDLDGSGNAKIQTGVGFLDHMLCLLAQRARIDVDITAQGDLDVGEHHTVEDVAIALGEALDTALGDGTGIRRYGSSLLPMDESLALVAIDLSGRAHTAFPTPLDGRIGNFDAQCIGEFFFAFARAGRLTLHLRLLAGENRHHQAEALFKGLGMALGQAIERVSETGVPSTKGVLR